MVVITDSREQKPYRYPGAMVKGLKTGDYTLEGLEDKVVVERKSKTDCYSSMGAGRKRFHNEFKRMAKFDYAAIVLECSLADFLIPPPFSKLSPKSAINTLISWSIQYGVHIFFAEDRRRGRGVTYRILEKYLKHKDDIHARQK